MNLRSIARAAALLAVMTGGLVAASPALADPIFPPPTTPIFVPDCAFGYVAGVQLGRVNPAVCTTQYSTAPSAAGMVWLGTSSAAPAFRGWGKVNANSTACTPLSCTNTGTTAYRWSATGWTSTKLARGTWAWLEPYGTERSWKWALVGSSWYAMRPADLDGYCRWGVHSYSNCTVRFAPMLG